MRDSEAEPLIQRLCWIDAQYAKADWKALFVGTVNNLLYQHRSKAAALEGRKKEDFHQLQVIGM